MNFLEILCNGKQFSTNYNFLSKKCDALSSIFEVDQFLHYFVVQLSSRHFVLLCLHTITHPAASVIRLPVDLDKDLARIGRTDAQIE